VTFTEGDATLASAVPLVGGTASYTTPSAASSGTVTATYSGDSTHAGSSGTVDQSAVCIG
jgi:hypothetical protein